MPLLV